MNRIAKYSLATLLGVGISNSCLAVVINDGGSYDGTDVGATDTFVAEKDKAGNPTAEEAWVNSILGSPDVEFTVKTEDVTYYGTDAADTYAFDLSSEPSYYIVKNATRMALFENLAALTWGVFDTTFLSSDMNLPGSEYTFSHVTRFSGGPGTEPGLGVPEPAPLALIALGGILLGWRNRQSRA